DIISVIVLAYNSADTITSTLESIAKQEYGAKNIELIISDDASQDLTISIIENWLVDNYLKFYFVNKIYHHKNLGIVANLDNAYKTASGKWIKVIAGDDILTSNCLSIYSEFTKKSQGRVFLSYIQSFSQNSIGIVKKDILPPRSQVVLLKHGTLQQQKKHLMNFSFSATPSLFIEKKLLDDIGYLDKKYRLMEDYPLWHKITDYGERIYFVPEITVLYRVQESVSRSKEKIVNLDFLTDILRFEKILIKRLSPVSITYHRRKLWCYLYPLLIRLVNNKKNIFSRGCIFLLNVILKPLYLSTIVRRYFEK
ncbi:glycosyltransferase, partial [Escherichia coli]|nr:glycosyltransferase [Escherichia coli]HAN2003893.1 glycosyltransferase [Escherichia coli]